jgi:SEC-C motif
MKRGAPKTTLDNLIHIVEINCLCWCGSGRKFKVCHMDREKQKPPRAWEADEAIHAWDKNSECPHVRTEVGDVCGKPAINSHTVPKKR